MMLGVGNWRRRGIIIGPLPYMLQEPSRQGFQHKACWFESDKLYLYSPSNARVGPHRTFILSTNELQNEFPYTRPLYESPNMNFDKSS